MNEEPDRVVIRDNRKIDPVTGEVRKKADPGSSTDEPGQAAADAAADAAAQAAEDDVPKAQELLLEERTRDLQRLQAEYANYRRRAERERLAAGELAVGRALSELLPVLDDLERARAHGDLTGGLKAVADKIDQAFAKLGLVAFGEVGDAFDPALHEAVMHDESDSVSQPTCTTVLRPGYKHGDRLLRPAMVGVTDPIHPVPSSAAAEPSASGEPSDVALDGEAAAGADAGDGGGDAASGDAGRDADREDASGDAASGATGEAGSEGFSDSGDA